MARSEIPTLLPLDTYSRMMVIPGWLFNQIERVDRPLRGGESCSGVIYQSGYYSDPNRIVGRDEVAQAIATAEQQIARMIGYWPAPRYICRDEKRWPVPKRGAQIQLPGFRLSWGHIITPGIEQWDLIEADLPIVYSVRSGAVWPDNAYDWATVTANVPPATTTDKCELVLVPGGKDPLTAEWAIRPLHVTLSALGVAVFQGWRWQFVIPELQFDPDTLRLEDDTHFLQGGIYGVGVDLYRHYTDTSVQAQVVWLPEECDLICEEYCVTGCVVPEDRRLSMVHILPATYNAVTKSWSRVTGLRYGLPSQSRSWYLAGYDDDQCLDCTGMGPSVQEAVVRLTNCHLPEAPCGCDPTRGRWERDREEMAVDSMDVELAQSTFGTTARGAVFAYNVFSNLGPLGQGG
jgi:hypothetical protein